MGQERDSVGMSSLGMILSLAGVLAVLLIGAIVVSATLPDNPTSTPTTTTTTHAAGSSGLQTTTTVARAGGIAQAAEAAACKSDLADVQAALAAFQATNGAYPTAPAPWSAGAYPTNFSPLTDAPAPGPYLKMPPSDDHYVILFDSSGHIWVEPPGTFTTSYDAANDGTRPSVCDRVAR